MGVLGAIWFTLLNGLWITKYLQKCVFSESNPQFFYISDILVQKLKLFVFYMMLNSQVLKKVPFQEKRKIKT